MKTTNSKSKSFMNHFAGKQENRLYTSALNLLVVSIRLITNGLRTT